MNIPEPFAHADVTKEVAAINATTRHWKAALWPFFLTVSTFESGSKCYTLELRPAMKFAITFGFFWKR